MTKTQLKLSPKVINTLQTSYFSIDSIGICLKHGGEMPVLFLIAIGSIHQPFFKATLENILLTDTFKKRTLVSESSYMQQCIHIQYLKWAKYKAGYSKIWVMI